MRSRYTRILCVLAASAVTTAVTCPADIPDRVPTGPWGGEHIGIVVTDSGATIEYDCAAGTITEPLRLDQSGHFDWRGVHYPGHGGPARINEPPDAHPARYTGHATTSQLVITLAILDMSVPEQTFTLQRGGNARVFKCL
jgi:hypothetical protein